MGTTSILHPIFIIIQPQKVICIRYFLRRGVEEVLCDRFDRFPFDPVVARRLDRFRLVCCDVVTRRNVRFICEHICFIVF